MSDSEENNVVIQQVNVRNVVEGKVPPLSLEGNLSQKWEEWILNFMIFLRASGLELEKDLRKVALLLHYIGSESRTIFKSFEVDIDTCTYKDLVDLFEKHCKPKKNLTVERHKFLTRSQQENETVEEFMISLKNLSITCELGSLKESLTCGMFIIGLQPKYHIIKQKLLLEETLTAEKVTRIAKNILTTQIQAQQLSRTNEAVVYKLDNQNKQSNGNRGQKYESSYSPSNKYGQKYNTQSQRNEATSSMYNDTSLRNETSNLSYRNDKSNSLNYQGINLHNQNASSPVLLDYTSPSTSEWRPCSPDLPNQPIQNRSPTSLLIDQRVECLPRTRSGRVIVRPRRFTFTENDSS